MSIENQPKPTRLNNIWQLQGSNPTEGYLLVILHGRGDSPLGWQNFLNELNISNLSAYLITAPDFHPGGGYSWYDPAPNQLDGISRSRKVLEQEFQKIFERGFTPDRCFLFGFSQGCLMTLEFGSRYSNKLAGYIGISGYCYDPNKVVQEASDTIKNADWLITHGPHDDILPIQTTRAQIEILKKGGFQITYKEYDKAHTFDEIEEAADVRQWIVARTNKTTN